METTDLLEISNLETAATLSLWVGFGGQIWMGGASHNGRKDQLTTHGIFRDALAGREIRLNCRQMEPAVSKLPSSRGCADSTIKLVMHNSVEFKSIEISF